MSESEVYVFKPVTKNRRCIMYCMHCEAGRVSVCVMLMFHLNLITTVLYSLGLSSGTCICYKRTLILGKDIQQRRYMICVYLGSISRSTLTAGVCLLESERIWRVIIRVIVFRGK